MVLIIKLCKHFIFVYFILIIQFNLKFLIYQVIINYYYLINYSCDSNIKEPLP